MAVVTIIAAGDMRGVLTRCGDAVMTGAAATQYLRVIDRYRRHPDRHAVAVFTNVGRQYMVRIFTRCGDAIMAVTATSSDIGMIKIRR